MRRIMGVVGMGLLLLAGCNNLPWIRHTTDTGMSVPTSNPTSADLVSAVNNNARRIQTLECRNVALDCKQGAEGAGLQGMLVCQPRQRDFRMSAKALGSTEVDLGSNHDEFWFWIKRSPQPFLFHCSHQDFARGAAQMPFPFQPDWIIEAMGVAEMDPQKQYEVVPNQGGVDLVEQSVSPQGQPVRKVTRFSRKQNYYQVTAHLLQDARGKDICAAYIRSIQQDQASGAVLPQLVMLVWPDQQIEMKMNLNGLMVNQALDSQRTARLFSRPVMEGVQSYNLARGLDAPPGGLQRTGVNFR